MSDVGRPSPASVVWSLLDRVGQYCIRKLAEASQRERAGKQHFSIASTLDPA